MRSLQQLMNLKGRVVLITGGAGHLGRAMGEGLAELGMSVVVHDINADGATAAAEALSKAHGVETLPLVADLADEKRTRGMIDEVNRRFGRLDVLINDAAFVGTSNLSGWAVPFAEQGMEAWRACLDVNLTAPFVLSQAATPLLAASGHGSIINIVSIYGLLGPDWRLYDGTAMGNPAAYGATKGGLAQLTRWLATTLAPKVRVNAIAAGGVARGQNPSFTDQYVSRTPMQRMATEEDFKGAAAYLASDLSAYVTGQVLAVDGGWTAW
jgi:NAD(P)-dependent dehydrogenase (short-subunit alcohol dehydrogenase family)